MAAVGSVSTLFRGGPGALRFSLSLAAQVRAGQPVALLQAHGPIAITIDVAAVERSLKW